jgi:orotate phosphoribosyltransferase
VVVVDDVILSGESLVDVVGCLKEEKCEILGAVAIVSYELPETVELLAQHNIRYTALTTFDVSILSQCKPEEFHIKNSKCIKI